MMDIRLEDFAAVVEQTTDPRRTPRPTGSTSNVLVYDADRRPCRDEVRGRPSDEVSAELVRAFTEGPGVVVFEGAFRDHSVIDRVTGVFDEIIADADGRGPGAAGDHFAKPGANDRVWNALEKLCGARARGRSSDYYANDVIALASAAWLGPGYQIDVASQRGQSRRSGAGAAPRLPPRLLHHAGSAQLPGPCAPLVAGADPAGRGRPCRHAGGERADALPALLAPVLRARLPRLATADVPGLLRRAPRPAAAARRATSCSSTRRCSMAPAPTARPTSAAWRTSCRSPRPSAGRWRRSTGCAW